MMVFFLQHSILPCQTLFASLSKIPLFHPHLPDKGRMDKARIFVKEMAENIAHNLTDKHLAGSDIVLNIGYDKNHLGVAAKLPP